MINKQDFYDIVLSCTDCKLCELGKNSAEKRLRPNGYIKSNFLMAGISPSANADPDKSDSLYYFDKTEDKTFKTNRDLLYNLFKNLLIDFDSVWKTNIQKCIPETNEINKEYFNQCYESTFIKELEMVQPKVIFALGNEVANILGVSDIKFGEMKFSEKVNCYVVKIYHPSYHTRGGISREDYINQLDKISNDIKNIVAQNSYINYHHHNQFSFRDGLGTEKDVAERLLELKYPGFCLTNHGNMNAHYRQYNECKKYGLKPIFGNEAYYTPFLKQINELKHSEADEDVQKRKEFSKATYHITLLAKNETGYYNLIKLSNKSWIDNFYKFPRVDDDLIEECKEGLIILSGCIGGYIPENLMEGNEDKAIEKAKKFKQMMGDDFYIEIQSTDYEPQKEANKKLSKLAKDLDIKMVITSDTHYVEKGDEDVQQVMILNNQDLNIEDLNDPNSKAWKFSVKDLYIKSIPEIANDFPTKLKNENFDGSDFIQCLLNINELFCKVEFFDLDTSLKLPKIYEDSELKFYELLKKGIDNRKLSIDDELEKRLKEEIEVIKSLGFIDYFLIMHDIIDYTKRTYGKYKVGPGRGSAAGSLVNYLLNITDINPLKYKMLLFERFLSPGRKDLVDIDVDFSPDIRDGVKKYIIDRFGRDYVCTIGNYQTMKLKSTIQDVFRTLNLPFADVVEVTKQIGDLSPDMEELPVSDIKEKYSSLKSLLDKYPEAERYIEKLKGLVRSSGQHAAGVIVSSNKLTENIPMTLTSSKEVVSANTEGGDFHELTAMGYIKYDILSLMTLKLIYDCNELIYKRHNIDLDWNEKEYDNEEMYSLLKKGDSYGIFQFSSKLATDYLKMMHPTDLNDLCASSALLRPGPLDQQMHIEYSNRKNNISEWKNINGLEEILNPTLGVIIYQEQILKICQELAGFSKEEANVFRKALVKYEKSPEHEKRRRAKVDSFANKLKKGLQDYMSENEAEELWQLIESFARYGFNYAHSLSYSVLSHRQLYQKYMFPLEFYCSMLNNEEMIDYPVIIKKINQFKARKINYDTNELIKEFKIKMLQPSLKSMNRDFQIENEDSIRHGLSKIKFITDKSFDLVKTHFNIENINDIEKIIMTKYETQSKSGKEQNKFLFDKKILAALLYSGAFDYLDLSRNEILEIINKKRKYTFPAMSNSDEAEKEKEYLGYSVKNDEILDESRKEFLKLMGDNYTLTEMFNRDDVPFAADLFRVSSIKSKKTKKGKSYKLVEADVVEDRYFPIFVWDEGIDVKMEKVYMGKFIKNNGFVTLIETDLVNEDK